MARIRTIKPQFWEDEKIAQLPHACRLFFIGCWNFADDQGVIRGNPSYLKATIFPYDENLRVSEISKWMDALVNARMIIPISYRNESYYLIRTFRDHQILDKRYQRYLIPCDFVNNYVSTTCTHSGHAELSAQEKEEEKDSIYRGKPNIENGVEERKLLFKKLLTPFKDEFGVVLLKEFYEYWTELNRSETKMKYELQSTWELGKRLGTWKRNSLNFKGKNNANRSDNRKVTAKPGGKGKSTI